MNLDRVALKPAQELLDLRLERAVPAVHAMALLAALWLMGRRYHGIVHDATLYVAQGLNRLHPSLSQDLFFVYGSQDSYSLFSALYAPLIALVGASAAALLIVVGGQIAFFGAAWVLAGYIDRATRWWSLSLLAVTAGIYGGGNVFRFAETFATARTLAEPLVLAMLAALLAGRPAIALLCVGFASVLHPLVALAGWGVLFVWMLATSRGRIALLAAGALAVAALALALAPSLDDEWKRVLLYRSRHLFVMQWTASDLARVAWAAGIAGLALFTGTASRRLLGAVLAVSLGGFAASALLVDLAENSLAAAAQLWRSLWLLQLVAVLVVPPLLARLWRTGDAGRLAAALLAASCCFSRTDQVFAAGLVLAGCVVLRLSAGKPDWPGAGRTKVGQVVALSLAAIGLLFDVQTQLPDAYAPDSALDWKSYVRVAGSVGLLLPLGALLWIITQSRVRRWAYPAVACLLALGIATWDERSQWARYVEDHDSSHPFIAHLEAGSQVYWPAVSSPAWTMLQTRNWLSADQGAGIVFARGTALEWSAREAASRRLRDEYAACKIARRHDCPIDSAAARAVCRLANGPTYVVLNGTVEGWRALAEDGYPGQTFRLYRCGDAA